jgi:hypothetical protein
MRRAVKFLAKEGLQLGTLTLHPPHTSKPSKSTKRRRERFQIPLRSSSLMKPTGSPCQPSNSSVLCSTKPASAWCSSACPGSRSEPHVSLSELFGVVSLHARVERSVRSGSGTCDVTLPAHPAILGTEANPPSGLSRCKTLLSDRPAVGEPIVTLH